MSRDHVSAGLGAPAARSFMVAQLGARMHFAVPRILYRSGRLSRLFTDLCASRPPLSLLRAWPGPWRPNSLRRLLLRTPQGVPPGLIRAYTRLGLGYARDFARTSSEAERVRLFLRVGRRFGDWVCRGDWAGAGGVFVYNTAGLEILRAARARKLAAVVEQTIAPYAYEHRLLAEERQRFPHWEPDPGPVGEFAEYAERERQEWSEADVILCGSSFVRDALAECGGPADRCRVVPYGVETSGFAVPVRPAHAGPLRVLTVGTVGLRKGVPYAIESAKRLRGRAVLRWVGPFKISPEARRDLGGDIDFVGGVPRAEIVAHYAWADVFLLPSLCEGSATASYEALTAGLPVVCTPNTGSIVRDGVEGLIIPPRDPEAIVGAIDRLAADADWRRTLAANALQRAAAADYDTYGRGLLAALDETGIGVPG